MKEREVKIKVDSLAGLNERLIAQGFIFRGKRRQRDVYFNHPCRDFSESDEALRLRFENGKVEITYKGPREDGRAVKVREEISCDIIGDAEKMLHRLGFRKVAEVFKEREVYEKEGVTVFLDKVEGLGEFVEIEGNADLKVVAESLDIPWRPVSLTYLEMMLTRKA